MSGGWLVGSAREGRRHRANLGLSQMRMCLTRNAPRQAGKTEIQLPIAQPLPLGGWAGGAGGLAVMAS